MNDLEISQIHCNDREITWLFCTHFGDFLQNGLQYRVRKQLKSKQEETNHLKKTEKGFRFSFVIILLSFTKMNAYSPGF